MVRLKASFFPFFFLLSLFQFHYGTIKRRVQYTEHQCVTGFQFHYGTIKSSLEMWYIRKIDYFNSTMVRLKAQHISNIALICVYFNSTMVRLKVLSLRWQAVRACIFQFHYGTIKRLYDCKPLSELTHFNSTMVRLKVMRLP